VNPRRATVDDLPAILALENQGFAPKQRWSEQSWADELAADNRTVLVIGDPVAGVITVQQVGGVAELNRIVVDSAHRGQGLARTLLSSGIATAITAEAEEMLLEVRHDNVAALALYARRGFAEIARRVDYYGAGVDAVILRLELESEENDD
jgi:ribosomal-protein-alanine N-acetyltransferase